jgi:iduronate 2-sulfatase
MGPGIGRMGFGSIGRSVLLSLCMGLSANGAPNVLLLCVDDLRPDLGCYGVAHASTPNIDRLAASGRLFKRHYVQAPTCGASRYSLLTGQYGAPDNHALMRRAKNEQRIASMPEVFRQAGFTTVAVGKISHHPGGHGGKHWNDPEAVEMPNAWDRQPLDCGPWDHPEGLMHGLANGATRRTTPYPAIEAVEGPAETYPDGLITATALGELARLVEDGKPFFLAVGWIRPHLPFGAPRRWLDLHATSSLSEIRHPARPTGQSTWHGSAEFFRYDHGGRDPRDDAAYAETLRRHYAACVSYADDQVGQLLDALDTHGLAENTIVVLWGDHGWHLGEHAVWGKHTLFEESLRSPLIIRNPGLPVPGECSAAVVETIDLFPTLCGLAGLPAPADLHGSSLEPQLANPAVRGRTAVSYTASAETLRSDRFRLIRHRATKERPTFFELYDHASPAGESVNLATRLPEQVVEMCLQLDQRLELAKE